MEYPQSYPIIWGEADALFEGITVKLKRVMLGICGYSKRVWKVLPPGDKLSLLIINDILVNKDWCEEGRHCLDFNCSLNKATPESLALAMGLKRLPAKFEEKFGKPINFNIDREGNLIDFKELFERNPQGGWLLKKETRGKN
jgi:hypothetical protein